MNQPRLVVIPDKLKIGVVNSQIIRRFQFDEVFYYTKRNDIKKKEKITSIFRVKRKSKIYVRDIWDFYKFHIYSVIFFKCFHITYDFRGINSEESYLRNGSNIRRFILYQLERYIYKRANKVYTVSNGLRSYLIGQYGYRNITVIPCCIDGKRVKKRLASSLNKIRPLKFCYLGSMSVWQNIEETLLVYKEIESKISSSLLIMTPNLDIAKHLCINSGIENYEIKSLDGDDVFWELDNVDFGFLFRSENIVNITASPVKFAEYISRGVIPIISNFVGDYSSEATNLALVISDNREIDIERLLSLISQDSYDRLYELANRLTWESYSSQEFL